MTTAQTLVNAETAARHLAWRSADTIRRQVRQGTIPEEFVHHRGRQVLFDLNELDSLVVRLTDLCRFKAYVGRVLPVLREALIRLTEKERTDLAQRIVGAVMEIKYLRAYLRT